LQEKIIIDTNIYIDIFNSNLHLELRNPFHYIVFLAHPVLHELWTGAKGKPEIKHLTVLQNEFVKSKRLIIPTVSTLILIGRVCQKLRASGKLDPKYPKHYNDITIAALARQTGAVVVTKNTGDFKLIQGLIDFDYREP
jgi:predicted nucleic acid-binding protein